MREETEKRGWTKDGRKRWKKRILESNDVERID